MEALEPSSRFYQDNGATVMTATLLALLLMVGAAIIPVLWFKKRGWF